MEKLRFVYLVTEEDHSFVSIFEYHDDFDYTNGESTKYIMDETSLKEHIKKYPHCSSIPSTKPTEKEAQRLFKKYGLSME